MIFLFLMFVVFLWKSFLTKFNNLLMKVSIFYISSLYDYQVLEKEILRNL